ncbi:glycoside hydrolase family 15 protein, partial [Candidatus Peregrinibacteria bacterium]|nr:glycoside hydrolase family 15 protein [Candidatus Peregrinibacteria bacterium]
EFNRDTYTYVWPRDGAFVSMAMDEAGHHEVARRFFDFCCRCQTEDGYLLHKYNPDGSLGSTWHPWFREGRAQLPIQEDETALVVLAIWKHFEKTRDFEFLQDMYERFVNRAGKFMKEFRETHSHLPLASYDPWEEHRGVFTYTTACTVAGLDAAAKICQMLGHYNHFEAFEAAAEETKQAMLYHLYDESQKTFVKKIKRENEKTIESDVTPDMSIAAIWKTGALPPDDPRVVATMQRLKQTLTVHTTVGGLARYTNDFYHSKEKPSKNVPGNPWFITTLWYAQWRIAVAQTKEDLAEAKAILEWATRHAGPTGMIAEQMHPRTGAPLSVAPLTWSHATFVETVLQFVKKEQQVTGS